VSVPYDQFLKEMRSAAPNWIAAIDALSSLAMFEMLPALGGLNPSRLGQVADQANQILARQRGWTQPAQRIQWAVQVVRTQQVPQPPPGLPVEQVQDARAYLGKRTEEKREPRKLVLNERTLTLSGKVRSFFRQGAFSFGSPGARTLFEQAMNEEKVDGKTARHSPALQELLVALAPRGLGIMRTFAPNQGPHGETKGSDMVCSAVDITGYAGGRFHYQVPRETLISNVERLFRAFPPGPAFDIGFVRPVGGPAGFDTRLDVFFAVPGHRVAAAFKPDGSWGVGAMLEPPKTRVLAALSGKKFGYLFPDGADHMHVKAY
jgi:hypothetical protein